MELVTVQKSVGRYDVFHPGETQINYHFYGIPKEVCDRPFFVFDNEDSFDLDVETDLEYMPLDFAYDFLNVIDKHFCYWTGRENLRKIIEYLAENKEEQYSLLAHKLLNKAILKRDCAIRDIEELTALINEIDNAKDHNNENN